MKRITAFLLAALLAMTFLASCGSSAINAVKSTEIKTVTEKTGKTYGEVLDAYCTGTKWRTFTSNYLTVIEFTGTTPDNQAVVIQWIETPDPNYNVCWAWSLDGKDQDVILGLVKWAMSAAKSLS